MRRSLSRARVAVTVVFALNGALFASIFSRLPAIQERAGVGDGALGLALLCAMLGLLVSQVGAGALVARVGSRHLVLVGLLDVSMNVHGLTVERGLQRPILSSLHASFSFGALGGAAVGGIVAGAGVG